ncbi:hypothetical protein GCM10009530_20430 [Microbispora corallina]|uniref:Uncharacterized protein n=1 Tax=Microbispora corallina TaxID=83302 RepID=A0ABQ4FU54_9ACTN|nr:hypothetical protein [Microbispora corallina]GIH38297.1 hypothetical protein Mco01_12970 [Microbispora corallina]
MFRRIEDLEGGDGDPRNFDEWASNFKGLSKNVLIPIVITVGVILLLCVVFGAILSGLS